MGQNGELLESVRKVLGASGGEGLMGFREFVESPDGLSLGGVYPFWLDECDRWNDRLCRYVLTGSLGGGKCRGGYERVSTADGYRRLDWLWARHSGGVASGFSEAVFGVEQFDGGFADTSHVYCERDVVLRRLVCKSGRVVTGTYTHPIMAYRVGSDGVEMVRCGDLRVGDYVARRFDGDLRLPAVSRIDWMEARRYCLYGVWLGDGHYGVCGGHPVLGYTSCDGLVRWCRDVEGHYSSRVYRSHSCLGYRLPKRRSLLDGLIDDMCHSRDKSIHEDVFGSRVRAFYVLYGLLLTDGWVNRGKGTLGYASVSESLIRGFCDILDWLGLQYSVHRRSDRTYWNREHGERRACRDSWRVTIGVSSSRLLYDAFLVYCPLLGIEVYSDHSRRIIDGLARDYDRVVGGRRNMKTCFSMGSAVGSIVSRFRSLRSGVDRSLRRKTDVCSRLLGNMLSNGGTSSNESFELLDSWFRDRGVDIGSSLRSFCGVRFDRIESIEDVVEDVYDVSVPSTHLFMSGGVLNHNTTFGSMLLCYYLYRVFSSGDIYQYFGIMRGSEIYILYFSVNLKTAQRSGFKQLRNMLCNSPWFQRHCPVDRNIESSIRFGNGLSIEFASGESHAIGLNVVGAVIDEANFRSGVGQGLMSEYGEVQQLAQQLEDRMKSRFSRDGGRRMLSLMLYVSSASYASSFIEGKMDEMRGDDRGRVVRAVQYKIQPQNYSSEKFEVFCGYQQLMPCIVQSAEHRRSLVRGMGMTDAVAAGWFEMVPVDLRDQFRKNIYLAIQNHCGRSTVSKGTFVTNYEVVKESYSDALYDMRPLLQDSVVCSDQDDVGLMDVFDEARFVNVDRPHALTLDLSLTGDHASLCCIRYDGLVDGVHHHSEVFNLDIIPPSFPGMLKISKVKDLILWLGERLNVGAFSSDAFQSEGLRQDVCEVLGLPNIRLSLDSSDIPALMWLSMLVDRRLSLQYLERQDREIREAVHDVAKHRVVKRDGSSDDQFQAMCGACFLSETVLTRGGDISSLVEARMNLVGSGNIRRMMSMCGYDGNMAWEATQVLRRGGDGIKAGMVYDRGDMPRTSGGVRLGVLGGIRGQMELRRAKVRSQGDGFRGSDVQEALRRGRRRGGVWDVLDGIDGGE